VIDTNGLAHTEMLVDSCGPPGHEPLVPLLPMPVTQSFPDIVAENGALLSPTPTGRQLLLDAFAAAVLPVVASAGVLIAAVPAIAASFLAADGRTSREAGLNVSRLITRSKPALAERTLQRTV
jgi:hypothetical protein